MLTLLKSAVEFIGTFTFLSVIVNTLSLSPNDFTGPISVGLALIVSIYFGGRVSGGHFNPAVTIMMLIKDKITVIESICYILAQVVGGVAAAYFDSLVKHCLSVIPN